MDRDERTLLEDGEPRLPSLPAPERRFLDPPSFDSAGGLTDAELPHASSSLRPPDDASCSCQPARCTTGTVDIWYLGWCESLCDYVSA